MHNIRGSLVFYVLLVFESQCSAQTVSLITTSNDIVLAGESISLICSVSDSNPEDDITMVITNETRQQITSGSVGLEVAATVYTEQTTTFNISTNHTFFCSVTWVNFTASTNLTISPLPIEQTYCTTNYTDGIIFRQSVSLTCYSSTLVVPSISWSSNSDVTFDEMKGLAWRMTRYNSINVEPSVNQNGTVFTCEREKLAPVNDTDRCSVGPINVYEELMIFIDPIVTTTDPAIFYPGQTKSYTCSSLPTSSVQWTTPNKLDDSGIESSVVGAMITVTVPSDSNFTGDVDIVCSGHVLDEIAKANLTLAIRNIESTKASSQPSENSLLFIVIGAVGGFVVLTTAIILFVACLKCKRNTSSVVKPDPDNPRVIIEREYDVAPFGSEGRQVSPERSVSDNHMIGNKPSTAEDTPGLYTMVGKGSGGNEQINNTTGTLPPPSTVKTDTGASSHEGQVNASFNKSDEINKVQQYGNDDYSTIQTDRMSVIYAAPDKKRQKVVENSRNEELDERDVSPSYAVVNKSRRNVINEEVFDDDGDDSDEDDDFWET